ncbi:MAG: asparagine synthase (glutamine-hydrolyzing) [Alphaproteobacteria bacterium]|nr:asparagine synthase (glutamine-hydrolyzing) [Alphaproteobacteria bacterium]
MCGIAGFAPKPDRPLLDAATLQRMTGLLAHRGPDAETFMVDRGFGLGHRRLSIIDVEGGDNPLEDPYGAVSLVFNGEIYNHLELRAELEANGARPRTRSDGEVILHGYLAYGLDRMLARIRGMFAFALFDRRDLTLHLARDPFGIKPLYHSTTRDALLFGSEIKAITGALPGPWELSRRGLLQSACLGFTLAPETIFERVKCLPPGHVATWRNGDLGIRPYHALTFAPDRETADPEALWHRFRETVGRHLMSEVPLGAFLSGGIDSAAVVAAMGEISDRPIDAVTVGVEAPEMDERRHARLTAHALGNINLHEETAGASITELLPKLAWHLDQPFADSSAAPTWLVSEAARRHVTVALSGDGGDENFAGYRRTRFDVLEDCIRQCVPTPVGRHVIGPLGRAWPSSPRLPQPLRAGTLLKNVGSDWLAAYIRSMARIPETRARRLLHTDVLTPEPLRIGFEQHAKAVADLDPLSRALAMDFRTWLADDILVKVDRMSMAHSLEVRVPLLDTDFVAYTAGLPTQAKLRRGQGKQLFRQALRNRIPDQILDRPKQGFHLPLDAWLTGPLQLRLRALASDRAGAVADYVDLDLVATSIEEHAQGITDRSTELWFVLMLDAFLEHGAHNARANRA